MDVNTKLMYYRNAYIYAVKFMQDKGMMKEYLEFLLESDERDGII